MQKNESRIRTLLARYEAAETTEAEEQELRALLQASVALPADLCWAKRLFDGVSALAEEQMPRRIVASKRPSLMRLAGRVAVAVAVVVVLVVAVHQFRSPYCYIDGMPIYDREEAMASMSCLAQLDRLDRSLNLWDEWIHTNKQ